MKPHYIPIARRTAAAARAALAVSALAALLVAAAPARAQLAAQLPAQLPAQVPAPLPLMPHIGIKAGVFLPSSTSFSNLAGNTWFKAGVDVGLPFSIIPAVGSMRAEVDYQVHGSSNIVPVTLEQIVQPSIGLHVPLYFGAGAGIWTGHIKGAGSSTTIGGRLIAGLELSRSAFVEAQYDFVSSIGGVRANGPSVMLGVRF